MPEDGCRLENQGAALPRHPWTNQCWYYYTNVDDCAGFTSFTIWVSLDHGITCTCRHRNNLLASLNISMLASSGCSRCCSDRGRMIRAVVTLWFSQIQFSQTPLLLWRYGRCPLYIWNLFSDHSWAFCKKSHHLIQAVDARWILGSKSIATLLLCLPYCDPTPYFLIIRVASRVTANKITNIFKSGHYFINICV